MAVTFSYKVRDREGQLHQGHIEGDSTSLVATRLREMGYTPIDIKEGAKSGLKADVTIPGLTDRVSANDIAMFSRQFATMIDAGLTLVRALGVLADQATNPTLSRTVTAVRNDVEQGSSLSTALSKHPKVFSSLYIAMVRAGEAGGALDEILKRLASTLEAQAGLRREIKSAMTYPAAVVGFVSLILAAMLLFIVPVFKKMYASLGGVLPLPTRILIHASNILIHSSWAVAIVAIVALVAFTRWKRTPKGRAIVDRLYLKLPVFGKLFHKTALARFTRIFAALTRSGVPILETLDISASTAGNEVVAEVIRESKLGVARGESITRNMEGNPAIPPLVSQMIAVGEESGSLDAMLEKLADFYDSEVKAMVAALTSLLEPLLIMIVGGAVGAMVISLYLPIFNVIKLIH